MGEKQRNVRLIEYVQMIIYCVRLSASVSGFYTFLRILCEFLPSILGIAASLLGKYLLDLFAGAAGTDTSEVPNTFFAFIGGIFIVKLLQNLLDKVKQYVQSMHNDLLREQLAVQLMDCSINIDLEYFDHTEYYDKLQAASGDIASVTQAMWNGISFLGAFLSFTAVFAVLWMERHLYGILLLVAALPYGIVSTEYTKSLYHLSMEQMNSERRKAYFQGICMEKRYAQDIRLFDIGDFLKEKYFTIWKEVFEKRRQVVRRKTVLMLALSCLPEVIFAGIEVDIGIRIFKGMATAGDYSLYTGMMTQFLSSFFVMAYSLSNIYDNKLRIMNLKDVLEFGNRIEDCGTIELKQVDTIDFEHVSFSYPGTQEKALKDVCFSLKKSEKTVFVGVNGSGKSTLIKLLLRMYEPDEGLIRINGIDIREYCIRSLRKNFSVYFQEMGNYCMTLYENVAIGDVERKEADEVYGALEKSSCDDVLKKAAKGLETNLTRIFDKEGLELSGGQFQKIALARCLYRRHTVLILDEPSSNLDPKSEHDIFEHLGEICDGEMTIFTSHRLSNVALADWIIVLENGTVIEEGTQKELLERNQRYAQLYRYQSEKFQQH